MTKVPAILSIGFRPFFLLAALIAIINPVLWVMTYLGHYSFSMITSSAFWHGHEMVFGFSGALIAGFILTASANWTNTKPYQGRAIFILVISWLLERLSFFLTGNTYISFILMNTFFPILGFMLFLKLKNFPKQRNVFVPIILGIMTGKIFYCYGQLFDAESFGEQSRELSTGLIRLIILLIGGRVIPFFSRKKNHGLEINVPNWLNPVALLPIIFLALPLPDSTPKLVMLFLYIWAIIFGLYRLYIWKPLKSIKVPILFILYIGVGFIYLGLVYELLGLYFEQFLFSKIPLHSLMVGGLGIVGMGIITRVSLGHTGRVIEGSNLTVLAYISIIIGAIFRVITPLVWEGNYVNGLYLSVGFWAFAFLLYIIEYGNMMFTKRPDGKEY
jgi:uncharacterized protein involved in response to NO